MAYRLFTDDTGWETSRKDLRYTCAALAADPSQAKLAKPLRAHLERWDVIDKQRRDADDAVVDANAVIAFLDGRLDHTVQALVDRLRYEFGTDHPTFQAYFPEPPSQLIRLGLESELDRVKTFHDIARERGASRDVQRILAEIAAIDTEGRKALAAREQAVAGVARVALKMMSWKEAANSARRTVESALMTYASEHNLPRDYPDAYFPPSRRSARKKARSSSEENGGKEKK
jgi:hypothetical protein